MHRALHVCSFVRPDILEQLVKMITLEPEEDAEDKVKFKSVIINNIVSVHFSCIAKYMFMHYMNRQLYSPVYRGTVGYVYRYKIV